MSLEQKEMKFKPRTNLNHNIATSHNLLHINNVSFFLSLIATQASQCNILLWMY